MISGFLKCLHNIWHITLLLMFEVPSHSPGFPPTSLVSSDPSLYFLLYRLLDVSVPSALCPGTKDTSTFIASTAINMTHQMSLFFLDPNIHFPTEQLHLEVPQAATYLSWTNHLPKPLLLFHTFTNCIIIHLNIQNRILSFILTPLNSSLTFQSPLLCY